MEKKIRGWTFFVVVILYCVIPVIISIIYIEQIILLLSIYLITLPIFVNYFNNYYNSRSAYKRILIRFTILIPILFEFILFISNIFSFSITLQIDKGMFITLILGIIVNIVSSIIWYQITKNK